MAERAQPELICQRLHKFFNALGRHNFPFKEDVLPENGLYILFEHGERAHGGIDRIVRIGTHRGRDNLRQRLSEHFLKKNKDRSIFRKNIGRALLNSRNDPFLAQWEIDLTPKAAREQYSGEVDLARLSEMENQVSAVIRNSFTFCVYPVEDRQRRLELEAGMIATVSHCTGCRPSKNWLGNYSPKKQIRESGLWLVQGMNGKGMTLAEIDKLENCIGRT